MSGPKGGGYTVVSAEELERRAIAAATDRYSRACGEFDAVVQSLAGYCVDVPAALRAVPGVSSAVQAAAAQLEAQLPELRERLTDQRVAAALAAMPKITLVLSAAEPTSAGTAGSTRATHVTKAARDAGMQAEELVAKADKMVADSLSATGADVPPALAAKLAGIRAATNRDQQRLALDDLRLAVQRVSDQQRVAVANTKARDAVLAALDGCEGAEAQRLRTAVQELAPGRDVPVPLAQAQEIARADLAARDARFVQGAVVDVLADLGYQIDESMAVAVAEAGVLVDLPGHRDHIARVQARHGQLRFSVVRVGDTAGISEAAAATQDTAAEVEACGVFEDIHAGLAAAGVSWRLDRKDPPGATKVARARSRPPTVARGTDPVRRRKRRAVEKERGK